MNLKQAAIKKLFEPITIGNVKVKNKIKLEALGVGYAKDGFVTDRLKNFYEEYASHMSKYEEREEVHREIDRLWQHMELCLVHPIDYKLHRYLSNLWEEKIDQLL